MSVMVPITPVTRTKKYLLYKPSLRNVEQHTDASFYFQGLERAFCICPVLETCQTNQTNIVCVHAEGRGEEEEKLTHEIPSKIVRVAHMLLSSIQAQIPCHHLEH